MFRKTVFILIFNALALSSFVREAFYLLSYYELRVMWVRSYGVGLAFFSEMLEECLVSNMNEVPLEQGQGQGKADIQ